MNKRIWIINQYGSTPSSGMGGRSYYLSKELAALGYSVTFVSASGSHLHKSSVTSSGQFTIRHEEGFRHVLVRTIPHEQARSPKRAVNWFLFSWALTKLTRAINDSPDLVMYSSPSPIGFLGARKIARDAGVPLVFDVRDLWPLTLTEVGGIHSNHPLMRSMSAVEKMAYRDASLVTSNLKQSINHMVALGMNPSKFRWVPNGILQAEVENPDPLSPDLVERWPKDKFVIGYAGTIGMVNQLRVFVDAIAQVSTTPGLAFVIVGKGSEKETLQRYARELGIENLLFFDAVPKAQVQNILRRCDALYLGWGDYPIYRFGIGANKIPEYMYARRPVLMSYGGGEDPISLSRCGYVVAPEDPRALADAMLRLFQLDPKERDAMGKRGRAFALEHFCYAKIALNLSEQFKALWKTQTLRAPAPQREG